jgi:hypothetical protein
MLRLVLGAGLVILLTVEDSQYSQEEIDDIQV